MVKPAKLFQPKGFKSIFVLLIVLLFSATSCRITKSVPEGEYLLDEISLTVETQEKNPEIKKGKLKNYVKQKPNRRVFVLFRLHLRMYNLARKDKDKAMDRFFRRLGEAPVILDTLKTYQTVENLEKHINNKGYYNAVVSEVTRRHKNKASVSFHVNTGKPHKIQEVNHIIEDSLVRKIVLNDIENSLLTKGSIFDMDLLRKERARIERVLKEEGYFDFSQEFITFTADTSMENKGVELDLIIRNRFTRTPFGDKISKPYLKYSINNIYIHTAYDPVSTYKLEEQGLLDTVLYDEQNFIFHSSPGIKLKTISDASLIIPGEIYSESSVQKTRDNLNSLRLYRAVNVFFRPDEDSENQFDNFLSFNDESENNQEPMGLLNCHIQLTPHTLQSYQLDLVGTNTASDVGIEGNLSYQHKNIFNGAEVLDTKFRAMVEFLSGENIFTNSLELGGSIGLNFPRFLGPFTGHGLIKRYSPRTHLSLSYNYQHRPDYTRTIAGTTIGYRWRSQNLFAHTFTPAEVNVINIFSIDENFLDRIANTYLANSYKNQVVTTTGYSIIFNNQAVQKRDNIVIRANAEVSGNVLTGLYSMFGEKADDGTYQIFNTSFSQYVKSDINFVYNQKIDEDNRLVYRLFAGAGLPYGNSKALPFEKRFFSGGSTGVRAWHARGLGPGSFVEEQLIFPNQTADIKLEANIEYRFPLFWLLESTLFLDAGNIWAITSADERPGAVFNLKTFYKQIALGTGTGLRLNLGFITIRFDLGMKLYDPGIRLPSEDNPTQEIVNHHWLPFNKKYTFREDFVFHFGIGYPF